MIGALIVAWVLSIALAHHLGARVGRPAEGFLLGLVLGPIGTALSASMRPSPSPAPAASAAATATAGPTANSQPVRLAGTGLWPRFLRWLTSLLEGRTAGMTDTTPRARVSVYLVMVGLLALQVVARYKWGFLPEKEWQAVHMLIGWTLAFAVLAVAHGPGILRRVARRTWIHLAVGAVSLTVFWYYGRSDSYREYFGSPPADLDSLWPLVPFGYFALGAVLYRMGIPFLVARLAYGLSFRDLGVPFGRVTPVGDEPGRVKGVGWIYLVAFLAIAPALVLASHGPDYLAKYPLARDIISPEQGIWIVHFLVYEALYGLVFVSGESFWRGYLTFGMERDLGLYGLPLMLVPYVTGHFGKPFSETLGAIVAGSLLGFLALKHRSVWLGVALHYGVALSMDLLTVGGNGFVIWS